MAEPVEVAAGDESIPVDPATVDAARVDVAAEEAACVEAAAVDETVMAADLAPQIPKLEFGLPAVFFK